MNTADGGPIYTETLIGRFPVEPWNTYSNLIFLFAFLYFAKGCKFNWKRYPLMCIALPILFVGFVGGTLYHATRSNHIFLMMDYIPISLICLIAAFYFWKQYTGNIFYAFLGLGLPFVLLRLLWIYPILAIMPRIVVGYCLLAGSLILPAFLCAKRNHWVAGKKLFGAVGFFIIAITFRSLDLRMEATFPMGTHFLWHLFGGLSTFCMLSFVKLYEEKLV